MTQALYRKWRPARFQDVVGQEHVTQTLQNAVAAGRLGHAYLFSGPRGTGKTTMARLLAKAANCLHDDPGQRPCNECPPCLAVNEGRFLDLIEIDAASNTGVDDIRDLREKISFSPSEGRYKVYIIDEVHMLSSAAFNALLKTVEEPPPHAKFVLATTEEHKVPLTIKSRCQLFSFRLLTKREIVGRLAWLAGQEQLDIDQETLSMIAYHGAGSLRDAESLLDQLVFAPGDKITLERARTVLGTASDAAISALADAWLAGDGATGLYIIHQALSAGTDARQFARQMVAYLRQLLLLQAAGREIALDLPGDRLADMKRQALEADRRQLIAAVKGFNEATRAIVSGWLPQLSLEMAFIELLPDDYSAPTAWLELDEQVSPEEPPPAIEPEQPPVPEKSSAKDQATVQARPASDEPERAPPKAMEPDDGPQLKDVIAVWPRLREQIRRKNGRLPELLASCKPLAYENDRLILGFEYGILKDKFDSDREAKTIVEQSLSELLKTRCIIQTAETGLYQGPKGEPIDPADFAALAQEMGGIIPDQ